jgi:hypothetical protein
MSRGKAPIGAGLWRMASMTSRGKRVLRSVDSIVNVKQGLFFLFRFDVRSPV